MEAKVFNGIVQMCTTMHNSVREKSEKYGPVGARTLSLALTTAPPMWRVITVGDHAWQVPGGDAAAQLRDVHLLPRAYQRDRAGDDELMMGSCYQLI